MIACLILLLHVLISPFRTRARLEAEIVLLRHQLDVQDLSHFWSVACLVEQSGRCLSTAICLIPLLRIVARQRSSGT
jgi:hypothetical protein